MWKTLPQYNENEYYNLADPDFHPESRIYPENFIPIPNPIRLYPDLGNTTFHQIVFRQNIQRLSYIFFLIKKEIQ